MEQPVVHPVPILSDELAAEVSAVEVEVANVLDRSKTSLLLRAMHTAFPLESFGLQHCKRIRRTADGDMLVLVRPVVVERDGDDGVGGCHYWPPNELADETATVALGPKMITKVPRSPPRTRAQFEVASKLWPVSFHEDQRLTRAVQGTLFTQAELLHFSRSMLQADAEALRAGGGVGAVLVDPKDPVSIQASAATGPAQSGGNGHPFAHCAMTVIHAESARQLGEHGDGRVFYRYPSPNTGGLGGVFKVHCHPALNHRFEVWQVAPLPGDGDHTENA